jgi:tRNA pseudouridine38-40 synthase
MEQAVPTKRYFIRMAFDGTPFCGWQWQLEGNSVQQAVNAALSKILNESIMCTGCGRTDSGVHAKEYYIHFDTAKTLPDSFLFKINNVVQQEIVFYEIFEVEKDKSARYSATERTYHYHLHTRKDPFVKLYSSEYRFFPYDWEKVQHCTSLLMQYKDFKPLSKFNPDNKTTLCDIYEAGWEQLDEYHYRFHIRANRYLHNMVRRIVATMLAIGAGRMSEEHFVHTMDTVGELDYILKAPPEGLFLVKVRYPFLEEKEYTHIL